MTIEELLARKLIFIAGKGGVGRSTMAAALALAAARAGRRVCIVESDGQEQMSRLFQTEPAGSQGKYIAPLVKAISLTLETTLKQFVTQRLPLHRISQHLINNRLVRYFLDATPGLKELLVLGTIVNLTEGSTDELVIVDLPATGHGLAMLTVPEVVIAAVQAGPLRQHAAKVHAVLNDPAVSAVCFVTLAEELATQETIELKDALRARLRIALGPVIANCVHLPLVEPRAHKHYAALVRRAEKDTTLAPLIAAAELTHARAELNARYIDRLTTAFDATPLIIPFLFVEAQGRDALAHLSDLLRDGGAA